METEGPCVRFLPAILVVLVMLAAACGAEDPDAEASSEVTVEDFRYARLPGGGRIVTGRLRNPTADPIQNAQIRIALYDADNRLVSTMSVTMRDIPAGGEKAFREPVLADESVLRARVRGVLVM